MNKLAVDIGTEFGSPLGRNITIGNLVSSVVSGAIAIAGIIIIFLLIMGGIGIIAGAGSENPEQVAKGKQAITWAVIGFIIVFVAYWIIRIIEIITGVPFVTAPSFQ